jgi:hypothetical protein
MKRESLAMLLALLIPLAGHSALPTAFEGVDLKTSNPVKLERGDKTVVVFLSARCPCSASHETEIKHLAKEYSGFQFLGVNSNADEDAALAREHFSQSAFPFPVLRDEKSQLANEFGALKTPHAYLIWRGEIVFEGGVDDSHDQTQAKKHYLREALQAVALGKNPEVARARTLGCAIARK